MVDVTEAARSILAVLLDWLSIAIIFVFIYLLLQLFTNGRGFGALRDLFNRGGGNNRGDGGDGGNGGGNRGDGGNGGGNGNGNGNGGPDDEDLMEDGPAEEIQADNRGLDPTNPGRIRIEAKDEGTGTPIPGVEVHIFPKGMEKTPREEQQDPRFMHIRGPTDAQGLFPQGGQAAMMGSGVVTIKASKARWWNVTWFKKGKFYQYTDALIPAGEEVVVPLVFRRDGEKPDGFHPKVMQVKVEDGKLIMEGQIKPGS